MAQDGRNLFDVASDRLRADLAEEVLKHIFSNRDATELWLTAEQWGAACDWLERRGRIPNSMNCLVCGVWLRPLGDELAAKEESPLVAL